jgi:molybdopterin-dependent oxidoreductase alpha subunit
MVSMDNSNSNKPYRKAAGGMDALASSVQALRRQGILGKGAKTMLRANQPHGFDCPGCAWPDRNPHSTFQFCENGVKAVAAEATARRVTADFFAAHTVSELAGWTDMALEEQGRLTEPMRYDAASDRYVPVTWDDAFELIGQALRALGNPDRAIFYTSGRTSNEAAFLYQLFVRQFGTNNFPDCSNMCHEPTSQAMPPQIGVGKGTVTLADFETTQAIFIFGQNPGTNHPRMLGELREAAKRGCRIVVFNPLRERGLERFADPKHPVELLGGQGVQLASHYYTVRIGGDLAAINGLIKAVLEAGAEDREFIEANCIGYPDLVATVSAMDWRDIERGSGLSEAQLREAAQVYIDSPASIICWGMGITQHRRSMATIQSLVNLLLLRGNIGRPGAGACPVRGHSNVQGDRTMGIYEKPSGLFLDRLGAEFGFEPPRRAGYDTIAAIEAMAADAGSVFIGMGGNFAAATPDTARTHTALRNCALTVQVSTKLNRSHVVHGRQALILPCLGRTEIDIQSGGMQAVTVEDSMSMVHRSAGMNPPASPQLLSEPMIVARLAAATLPNSTVPWLWLVEDYDRIREHIGRVVPGFENFNERVSVPGGFHLRNAARERDWSGIGGRARFLAHALDPDDGTVIAPDLLTLTTIRSHDQYNTTVYGLRDRYRGVDGERRVLFIAAADLQRLGWSADQRVDIVSVWEDGERVAPSFRLVEYDIPAGCVAAYYPETNVLVPLGHHAEGARTPASKSIPVRLRPARQDDDVATATP